MKINFSKSGSLLIEVLLSVVILSTALTLMIQSMTASLRAIQYGAGYTTALILLDNQMCELLRKGAIQTGLREAKELTRAGDSLTTYRYSLQTASLDDAAGKGINQVDATVAWRSGKKDNAIGLTTFLFAALP
ncbi:MAG: hypothetical protein HY210_03400 [Candidatus Omnitrophica bacterium]|nr:hypothetical protein [Candidatus Omnitrophota bacterium]MBI5023374.1 hypothetical protein [Candidatus Omnitrophota bacterium]